MLSLEYAAGLFDGEGFITVTYYEKETFKYTRCQVKVGISMTYRPVMEQFHQTFDGSFYINAAANLRNPKNRIAYEWHAGSRKAQAFLKSVYPFLIVKREQARLALELQDHIALHYNAMRYSHGFCAGRDEILAHRRNLVQQIRILKKETFSSQK